MKKLNIIAAVVAVALASPAAATNKPPQSGGSSSSSSATAIAGASSSSSVKNTVAQGQGQAQRQSVNVEGSASAPGIAVAGDCGFAISAGVVGAAGGIAFSGRNCNIIREAEALRALGRPDLALRHLTHIGRVKETLADAQKAGAGTVSTSGAVAHVNPTWTKCELSPDGGRLIVRPRSENLRAQAIADCKAARLH